MSSNRREIYQDVGILLLCYAGGGSRIQPSVETKHEEFAQRPLGEMTATSGHIFLLKVFQFFLVPVWSS